jgi:hypothetical protein
VGQSQLQGSTGDEADDVDAIPLSLGSIMRPTIMISVDVSRSGGHLIDMFHSLRILHLSLLSIHFFLYVWSWSLRTLSFSKMTKGSRRPHSKFFLQIALVSSRCGKKTIRFLIARGKELRGSCEATI